MAFGGPEGSAQSDLASSFEDGDDHDVGHPDRADEQGDGAEAQEQAVERALGVGLGDQGGGGLADVDFAGVLGVGGRREHGLTAADLAGLGSQVDGGGMPVEAEVVLGGGEPDEHGGVDLRGERWRSSRCRRRRTTVVEPDALAGIDAVDPEALGGGRAEHGDGFFGGGGVEVAPSATVVPHGGEQAEAGRVDERALVSMEGMSGLR